MTFSAPTRCSRAVTHHGDAGHELHDGIVTQMECRLSVSMYVLRVIAQTPLGDEAVDGLVGVVLKGRVGQIGENVGLVNHGTLQLAGRAGVEHATRQGRVDDAIDQSLCAHVKLVGDT